MGSYLENKGNMRVEDEHGFGGGDFDFGEWNEVLTA